MNIYKKSKWIFLPDAFLGTIIPVITWPFIIFHILSYFTNSLTLTTTGISIKKGIVNVTSVEVPYTKINNVLVKQSFLGQILGYGDIFIFTGNNLVEKFIKVTNPNEIKTLIQAKIT